MQTRHENSAPTVVGYQNYNTRKDGQILTATFTTVSNAKKFKLSEVGLTGYENVTRWRDDRGKFSGQVYLTKISDLGYTMDDEEMFGDDTIQFTYTDTYDKDNGVWKGGYWQDFNGTKVTADNDFVVDFGEALWVTMPKSYEGETYKFVFSGAVAAEDSSYNLRKDGNVVGNPMPVTIGLSKVGLTGYENVTRWRDDRGKFSGQVYLTKISDLGYTMDDEEMFGDDTIQFTYTDTYDKDNGVWKGGYWQDFNGTKVTADNDWDIPAGQGLWLTAPKSYEGETYILEFPTPLNTSSAE